MLAPIIPHNCGSYRGTILASGGFLTNMTLKHLLAELGYIEIPNIKRHARGLLKALEGSNRKEFLEYRCYTDEEIDRMTDPAFTTLLNLRNP